DAEDDDSRTEVQPRFPDHAGGDCPPDRELRRGGLVRRSVAELPHRVRGRLGGGGASIGILHGDSVVDPGHEGPEHLLAADREHVGAVAAGVALASAFCTEMASSTWGTKGQNIFLPEIAGTGGRAMCAASAEMMRPTAAVMPSPRVPGMTAKTRLSRDRTTVRFEARIVVAVWVHASASAVR